MNGVVQVPGKVDLSHRVNSYDMKAFDKGKPFQMKELAEILPWCWWCLPIQRCQFLVNEKNVNIVVIVFHYTNSSIYVIGWKDGGYNKSSKHHIVRTNRVIGGKHTGSNQCTALI
jgi:hypothetical protein